ncbi:MAG: CHASE3 domain-containing protein [Proteobacteria bacterium]|nr:CHASE3 domain-containing protein [Pseudomonadota bacterium]
MRLKWWQLALVVSVSIGFVILLYVVAEFGRLRLVTAQDDVRRAQGQLARVVDLYQLVMNAESGHRGYLLTGDPSYLEPLHRAEGQIDNLGRQLVQTYRGRDERVDSAIRQLGPLARSRMKQMQESIAVYEALGQSAGFRLANSPTRHDTESTFRESAQITGDYQRALMGSSLENLERDLMLAGRLNLATLLLGLGLAVTAAIALVRIERNRAEAATGLQRQHDELKSQFDAQTRELTGLARHLQHVQEEERARLSRGLHDELGGVLLAARMDVTWMQRHATGDDADVTMRLERLKQVLDQGIELKRRVVEELRPTLLDTMGLLAALRWQGEETCRRADLRCTERFPDEEPQFSRAGAIALFRVVQEALANVAKHARASEVDIALELTDSEVVVTVQDNGVGAAPEDLNRPRSHGVAGLRHRIHVLGGLLDISSAPNRGTTVRVRVPLANVSGTSGADDGDSGTFTSVPRAVGPGPAA